MTVPGDFEGIKKPIYIAVGDKDSLLPEEQMKQIQDFMSENIKTPNEVEVYPDQASRDAEREVLWGMLTLVRFTAGLSAATGAPTRTRRPWTTPPSRASTFSKSISHEASMHAGGRENVDRACHVVQMYTI